MNTIAKALCVGLMVGGVVGCNTHKPPATQPNYQTLSPEAQRNLEQARKLNGQAIKQLDNKEWKDAEQTLKRALDADASFGPAHNNLGLAYFQQSQLYLAAWEFQYAMKLMPEQADPRNNLGLVYETAGKWDLAVQWYDDALKLAPNEPEYLGNAARARVRRGDRDGRLRELLEQLVLHDTRAEWVQWARKQLALMPANAQRTQQ